MKSLTEINTLKAVRIPERLSMMPGGILDNFVRNPKRFEHVNLRSRFHIDGQGTLDNRDDCGVILISKLPQA